jgi:hypothetical protein
MKALMVFLLAVATCSIAQVVTVPINDRYDPGNPLGNDGTFSIDKKVDGATLTSSEWHKWTVRNVSLKRIVAFRERLEVRGGDTLYELDNDMFFGSTSLEPGATLDYSTQPNSIHRRPSPPDAQLQNPVAEVTRRWVQFEDGTTFGDTEYGKEFLSSRRANLQLLEKLNQSYVDEGPEGFVRQLQQPSVLSNRYGQELHEFQQSQGTDKAVEMLRMYLSAAELHKNLL